MPILFVGGGDAEIDPLIYPFMGRIIGQLGDIRAPFGTVRIGALGGTGGAGG